MLIKFVVIGLSVVICVSIASELVAEELSDVLCGPRCLVVASAAFGNEVTLASAKKLCRVKEEGCSLADLNAAARKLGLQTRLVRTDLESLALRMERENFLCLAWLHEKHFVLFADIEEGHVTVIDAPEMHRVQQGFVTAGWSGEALLLSDIELAPEESLRDGRFSGLPVLTAGIVVLCLVCVGVFLRKKWCGIA